MKDFQLVIDWEKLGLSCSKCGSNKRSIYVVEGKYYCNQCTFLII